MGRSEKNAFDWSLTWSPEEDVETWPDFLRDWMSHKSVTRCYAILERHTSDDKWHLHIGFTFYRSYKSDYKWYEAACKKAGLTSPALEIKYHDNILGLVGGYCAKSEAGDRKLLFKKGFSDEQLEWGHDQYLRGLRKQRVRKFADKHHVITPDKFDTVVGAQMCELECDEAEAIISLAEDGWSFSRSKRGLSGLYRDLCMVQKTVTGLHTTVQADSP